MRGGGNRTLGYLGGRDVGYKKKRVGGRKNCQPRQTMEPAVSDRCVPVVTFAGQAGPIKKKMTWA